MPLFFFHMCNGNGFIEDEEGQDLPDAAAARAAATREARSMMMDELRSGELDLSSFIEVEDAAHAHLFTLHFHEAVAVKGGPGEGAP
jgi:hypothetical protein